MHDKPIAIDLAAIERRRDWCMIAVTLPTVVLIVSVINLIKLNSSIAGGGWWHSLLTPVFGWLTLLSAILVPVAGLAGAIGLRWCIRWTTAALRELPEGWSRAIRLHAGERIGCVKVRRCDPPSLLIETTRYPWIMQSLASRGLLVSLAFMLSIFATSAQTRGLSTMLWPLIFILCMHVLPALAGLSTRLLEIARIDGTLRVRTSASLWGMRIPLLSKHHVTTQVAFDLISHPHRDTFTWRFVATDADRRVLFAHDMGTSDVGRVHGMMLRDGLRNALT
ncbi:MAG TPA: hypothetical protein VK157_05910 [Phycisphaerales bacterium]|nr:hypothetical protein [Phycisphaerales bacterium]